MLMARGQRENECEPPLDSQRKTLLAYKAQNPPEEGDVLSLHPAPFFKHQLLLLCVRIAQSMRDRTDIDLC